MKNLHNITMLGGFLALTAASDGAISYTLNPGMTDLAGGVAYWDTSEVVSGGTLVGFHRVNSVNSPNILSASPNSNQFTFDTGVASNFNMRWESSFVSSGGGGSAPQGGSPSFEEGSSTVFIADTNGSQMFFMVGSEFVSGDGVYGMASGMSGQVLVEGDSGTGAGGAFVSGASGSEWDLEGNLVVGDGIALAEGSSIYSFGFGFGGGDAGVGTFNTGVVPEPSGISLLALGAFGIGLKRRR